MDRSIIKISSMALALIGYPKSKEQALTGHDPDVDWVFVLEGILFDLAAQ
jgi:hypothetical protein